MRAVLRVYVPTMSHPFYCILALAEAATEFKDAERKPCATYVHPHPAIWTVFPPTDLRCLLYSTYVAARGAL